MTDAEWIEPLKHHIFEYVYHRWFKPGKHDIEYGQFLARTILPDGLTIEEGAQAREIVAEFMTLHGNLCRLIEETKQKMIDFDNQGGTIWESLAWALQSLPESACRYHAVKNVM